MHLSPVVPINLESTVSWLSLFHNQYGPISLYQLIYVYFIICFFTYMAKQDAFSLIIITKRERKLTQHSKNAYRAEHHFKLKTHNTYLPRNQNHNRRLSFIHHKTHASSCCRHSDLASCLGVPVSS